jgi:hypothetical protein
MSAARPSDDVRERIVAHAKSCEHALTFEQECVSGADFLNAALMADVAGWDSVLAFALSTELV